MAPILVVADIHLTAAVDERYRWDVFDFLRLHALRNQVQYILLCGDVCDAKDQHTAWLVNRLVAELRKLREATGAEIVWLKGNHDYIDPETPFFGFIDAIEGLRYVVRPTVADLGDFRCGLVPHSHDWHEQASWRRSFPLRPVSGPYDLLFAHQTFKGALASNGDRMDGVPLATVAADTVGCLVVSGDIHVPQIVGNVTYVGSPHAINFGDDFEGRVLLVTPDRIKPVPNKAAVARHMIKLRASEIRGKWIEKLYERDHCKVQLTVEQRDSPDIPDMRQEIRERIAGAGAECFGIDVSLIRRRSDRRRRVADLANDTGGRATPRQVFEEYCRHKKIDDQTARAGLGFVQ